MQDFRGLDRQQWHQRYLAQAGWTQHIRQHIFKTIKADPGEPILEIGSGTGAVLASLLTQGHNHLTGIDIDRPSLSFAQSTYHAFKLVQGDGHHLPFYQDHFFVTLCHYLLMWTENPARILREMLRVTRPGGWVLALAEPDHDGRLDYPPPLDQLGKQQTQALIDQGVDVSIGRKLRSLFHQTGLRDVEVGILAAQWMQIDELAMDETEWLMIRADLAGRMTPAELAEHQRIDQQAREEGKRILFIPTFYALGRVP